jgi:hypothetical protein
MLIVAAATFVLCAPSVGAGVIPKVPEYCHIICVDEDLCSELECFDVVEQQWTTCLEYNWILYCSGGGGGCTPHFVFEYDSIVGAWAVDDWPENTCTHMAAVIWIYYDENWCPGSPDPSYTCYEVETGNYGWAGWCCTLYECGGIGSCSEWSGY